MDGDDTVVVQEHINSQLVMSEIDPDVLIRNRDQSSNANSNGEDQEPNDEQNLQNNRNLNFTKLLKKIYEHIEQVRYGLQRDTYKRCTHNEWLLVGTLIDKILFFLYCSIVIICTFTIFRN